MSPRRLTWHQLPSLSPDWTRETPGSVRHLCFSCQGTSLHLGRLDVKYVTYGLGKTEDCSVLRAAAWPRLLTTALGSPILSRTQEPARAGSSGRSQAITWRLGP
jgi:hypothetical protein